MPEVDYDKAWHKLKAHVSTKRSHGADELKVRMHEIEVESLVPEGEQGYDTTPLPHRSDRPTHPTAA